ncbi:MAG: protease HtpX [Deltaproteobacteria bacterium]|nr:protease HtpX [Deltaproteobacteria bacterium]
MAKRIFLFLITNILVIVTISFILSFLGVGNYIGRDGLDYQALLIFCLVWGMSGAFISLALSRQMAKWMMGVKLVDSSMGGEAGWLVNTVHQMARRANLPAMPQVGIYDSPEVNAFATGPTKSRSLVAVSSGLLSTMSREQVEGVLGHEVAHIQNGDMVTMTLLQGVINAFVMFLARVIAFAVSQNVKAENRAMVNILVVMVLQIVLSILGALVVCWFSRQREFRADQGGAKLSSPSSMRSALEGLRRLYTPAIEEEAKMHPSMAALKISGAKGGWMALFSTHPPLEERIKRLS